MSVLHLQEKLGTGYFATDGQFGFYDPVQDYKRHSGELMLSERRDNIRAHSLFAEIGCITEDNLDGILDDIREDCLEMKAFFLKLDKSSGDEDFFVGLEL